MPDDNTCAKTPIPVEPLDSIDPLDPSEPREGESYFDGPYLVFTEAYHLRRGYCCASGCRHCPYGFVKPEINLR